MSTSRQLPRDRPTPHPPHKTPPSPTDRRHPAAPATFCSLPALPVRLLRPLRVPSAYLLPHPIPASRSSRRYLLAVTAHPYRGLVRPALHKGPATTRTTTPPSLYGATPPHPGAGRDNHRKILPREWFYLPNIPYGKGGFDGSGGGGKLSPGVITLMNPGPYWPLYLWGWHVGRGQRTALCQGGVLAARWSPASLGTVR